MPANKISINLTRYGIILAKKPDPSANPNVSELTTKDLLMGLPFLKSKQDTASASLPVEVRKPDAKDDFDSLEVAASDLLDAIQIKDPKAIADALRAAYELLSEPQGPQE